MGFIVIKLAGEVGSDQRRILVAARACMLLHRPAVMMQLGCDALSVMMGLCFLQANSACTQSVGR